MASNTINGYIRWVHLLPVLLGLSTIASGAAWKIIDAHAANPHKDAVTAREFESLREDLKEIKQDLRIIRQQLNYKMDKR